MTRAHKISNLLGVTLPLVGLIAAMALLWGSFFHAFDLVLLVVGYLLTGIGITVGYHRLFTHRAFADEAVGAVHVRDPRVDGRRRPGARVGRQTTGSTISSPTRKATRTVRT